MYLGVTGKPVHTRVCRYAWIYRDMPACTRLYPVPGLTEAYPGIAGYTRACPRIPWHTKVNAESTVDERKVTVRGSLNKSTSILLLLLLSLLLPLLLFCCYVS